MKKLYTLILAAGLGKRMKSRHPKVAHKVCGRPMVEWVVRSAKAAGSDDVIVVVGHGADEVKSILSDDVKFAYQEKQLGTGHAVMMAKDMLPDEGDIMILTGDTPLITSGTLKEFYDFHLNEGNSITILSSIFDDPQGYGRIVRGSDGGVLKIVEDKDADEKIKGIHEINSAMYIFKLDYLKKSLEHINNNNAQSEYYLTDAIEIVKNMGGKIGAYKVHSEEIMGVNSRVQLAEAEKVMRKRINERHMLEGVTIIDPDNTYIGPDVNIGIDTIIYPGTIIEGNSTIGKDCEIGPNSRIIDSEIGNGCKIIFSMITESKLCNNIKLGPFAQIRPDSVIHDNAKLGNFIEIKKSIIGEGTKVPHLTYIGDAEVGKRVNMGCGSIVVNYDGKRKHKTTIGDDVFVGCNVNLVSPVKVNNNAFIAAGSTITDEVPDGALAIARCRQTNKEGWVEGRRKKGGL
ncbi:bifunctional UDP-N-acetylglucosamine diphosphorylase/glucosamine-1-phosphate N-acetyltransferase GlmU [Thermoanaerobacterium sp. RBIITD]|uniref:bifunctional UDP-N-acetylglucosamine diphosphorylase/glucosamine-1-phosphate N-acetyltransferase GlmU n=1 Tax=Thermoanaerobacterium sp. RBIITD TaxID=1550240 RepID=UPI000BB6EC0C|nr:bifunctional UDP-N-acetylglucosamine diphosphorylase/glucosamine-1-phosphate N-acetyltransferase GlmU [Thermoanaerobacterium sp. RBIITD]SNX53928.1 bifunctional UDP-N-acetylglucosamine pyrophosphorylase / Glucosamine-1-phosphate N-acetyltransferase [Thermoanaerobacterium sp. RBIITD]